MYTDMVGYTALGQRNESLSLALVEEQRKLIRPILARHNGREIKTMGDAFLVEFPNATDSVRCGYDIQRAIREFNLSLASDKRIHLRIGVHLGEVTESQGDISGDAVNVASRIYPLAEDGGVCVTRTVCDFVRGKVDIPLSSIGAKTLKNVAEPIEVYKMEMPWEQSTRTEAHSYPTNRVAILPFTSFSSNPDDAYFADGMTEEIISTVSGISGLRVISRTSVMGYKGTTKKVKEIGKELEVGSVLEGSFRKAGNRIRVTTQLINVADDEHLWAQNYDRNLDDVFEVQSDVAKQVANALRVRILSPEKERIEKKPTDSTSAYSLYLKGRSSWNKRNAVDVTKARDYFEQAVEEDPNFALGYAGGADCCLLLRDYLIDREANLEKAKVMVSKALEIDPGLAEAHMEKAYVLMDEYDLRHAEEEFEKAIELKPSDATAHMRYYGLLLCEVRWEEALREIERALELDPLSGAINSNHGGYYLYRMEYAKAVEPYKRAAELGLLAAHANLAFVYGRLKMFDEMKREMAVWVEQYQGPYAQLYADAYAAFSAEDKETVGRLLPELESHFLETEGTSAFEMALFSFFLGDNDRVFEWLERSYSRKEGSILDVACHPFLAGIRTDPRYLDLLKRLGLD